MVRWLDGKMDWWHDGMMQVAGVYGEEVIVSSEAPERWGAERSGEERRGQQMRTKDNELNTTINIMLG